MVIDEDGRETSHPPPPFPQFDGGFSPALDSPQICIFPSPTKKLVTFFLTSSRTPIFF